MGLSKIYKWGICCLPNPESPKTYWACFNTVGAVGKQLFIDSIWNGVTFGLQNNFQEFNWGGEALYGLCVG